MYYFILYGTKTDVQLLSEIINTACICAIRPGFVLKCQKYSANQGKHNLKYKLKDDSGFVYKH